MLDSARPSLSVLREKLGILQGDLQKREFLKSSSLSTGVPTGVLCEVTGTARTEWILSLLNENPDLTTFWVEEKLSILPTAIHQRGVDLSRILIAEAEDKLFQTLRKALRSSLFNCLVLPGTIHEVKMLKALQLFTRGSQATVFFLSKSRKISWSIPFQIEANWREDMKGFTVQVLKSKFSQEASAYSEKSV